MSWSRLPAELRLNIFQYLESSLSRPYQSPYHRRLERDLQSRQAEQSQYAAVNDEWRAYFEAGNFRNLILGYADILEFGRIVVRSHRGLLVRQIWLRVEFPTYGCNKCEKEEYREEHKENEMRFTCAYRGLISFLSELNADHPGISLELSVHSPSDAEHYCQELKSTMNDTVWYVSGNHVRIPDDRFHKWRDDARPMLSTGAYQRAFGNPRGIGIDATSLNLPHVNSSAKAVVVKELVIRLQFYRHFSVRVGLCRMFQTLPGLESFRYECWPGLNAGTNETARAFRERGQKYLVNALVVCKNLGRISFYQPKEDSYREIPSPRPPAPRLGWNLGLASGQLRELYVSRMVDAKDFFHKFWPSATAREKSFRIEWPHLEYLSLTTCLLSTTSRQDLLQAAASAAGWMPKLKTMELEGYKNEDQFLYLEQDRQHSIFVSRILAEKLETSTIERWQRLVDIRGSPYKLEVAGLPEPPPSISWKSVTDSTARQLSNTRRRRLLVPST
jgi:hypothetical protein